MNKGKPWGFERAVHLTSNIFMHISAILLLIMLLLGTTDVLGRYLFNEPISGATEIIEILLPGIVLLGWAYVQLDKSHINVDIIYNRFPPRFKAIVSLCITALAMAVMALIVWQGVDQVIANFQMGRLIRNINVPIYLPQLLVPIGAFVLLLELIVDFLTSIREIKKG